MAKQVQRVERAAVATQVNPDVALLAKELFVQNWQPTTGYTAERIVAQCYEAAEAFITHAQSRSELQPVETV